MKKIIKLLSLVCLANSILLFSSQTAASKESAAASAPAGAPVPAPAAAIKGLDEAQNEQITVIVQRTVVNQETKKKEPVEVERILIPRYLMQHSDLMRTVLEDDKDAKEIVLNADLFKIPLKVLAEILLITHDKQEKRNKNNKEIEDLKQTIAKLKKDNPTLLSKRGDEFLKSQDDLFKKYPEIRNKAKEKMQKAFQGIDLITILKSINYLGIADILEWARIELFNQLILNYEKTEYADTLFRIKKLPPELQKLIVSGIFAIPFIENLMKNMPTPVKYTFSQGNGQYYVSNDGNFVCIYKIGSVELWDIRDQKNAKKLTAFPNVFAAACAWNSDKSKVAIATDIKGTDEVLNIYDLSAHKIVLQFPSTIIDMFWDPREFIYGLSITTGDLQRINSKDGKEVKIIGEVQNLYDVSQSSAVYKDRKDKAYILDVERGAKIPLDTEEVIYGASTSPNDKSVVAQYQSHGIGRVALFKAEDGKRLQLLHQVKAVCWTSDSKNLAGIQFDHTVFVYDIDDSQRYYGSKVVLNVRELKWQDPHALMVVSDSGITFIDMSEFFQRKKHADHLSTIDQLLPILPILILKPENEKGRELIQNMFDTWLKTINIPTTVHSAQKKDAKFAKTKNFGSGGQSMPLKTYEEELVELPASSRLTKAGEKEKQSAAGESIKPQATWSETHQIIKEDLKKNPIKKQELDKWIKLISDARATFNVNAKDNDGRTIKQLLLEANNKHRLSSRFIKEWKELTELFD